MSQLKNDILKAVLYFDIFHHPIDIDEIHRYLPSKHNKESIQPILQELVTSNSLKSLDGFYGYGDIEKNVKQRLTYNLNAKDIMPKAIENGLKIKKFPFVQAVFISGGLSKGVFKDQVDEADDIDYFIIAKKNRLWIAKFATKFYKYFYLNNSKQYFCVNYYITDESLKIPEENIYTATELLTLIPVASEKYFSKLLEENSWTIKYLPNAEVAGDFVMQKEDHDKNFISKIIQGICIGPIGYTIDHLLMLTNQLRNYILYYKKYKKSNYDLRFRSNKKESKIHPESHQARFLEEYARRIDFKQMQLSDV